MAQQIDYAALARQYGATSSTAPKVDYASLAKQFGGTSNSAPDVDMSNVAGAQGPLPTPAAHPSVNLRGGAGNLETIPAPDSEPGVVGALKTGVHNFGARVANSGVALLKPLISPISAGKDILARGGFPLTPDAIKAASYNPSGPDAGATVENMLGDAAMGLLSHGASSLVSDIPGMARTAIAGDVKKPMAGSNISPLERYQAAKRVGVNLPPAQATNSSLLKPLDWINREGLLNAPMHEKLGAANAAALTESTDELLNRMSPADPDTGGRIIQDRLRAPFVDLQNQAHEALEDLSPLGREQGGARLQSLLKGNQGELKTTGGEREQATRDAYGDLPISSYDPMRSTARTVLQQNEP